MKRNSEAAICSGRTIGDQLDACHSARAKRLESPQIAKDSWQRPANCYRSIVGDWWWVLGRKDNAWEKHVGKAKFHGVKAQVFPFELSRNFEAD